MNRIISDRTTGGFALLLAGLLLAAPLWADHPGRAELDPLEAAFLYQFTKFVTWPAESFASPGAPIRIAVAGDDPFGDLLESVVDGKKVGGRPFEVLRLRSPEDLDRCHVLFVCEHVETEYLDSEKTIERPGLLTVGETARFTREGGMIRFFLEERKLRFEVNPAAAARSGLQIGSQMLKLARIVEDGARLLETGRGDFFLARAPGALPAGFSGHGPSPVPDNPARKW